MTDGTPLPAALSGVTVQRLIEIDQALLYLITGALDYLVIKEPLEQTGALTPETAKNALSVALEVYLNTMDFVIPVGATMTWHMATPPSNWLVCDGQSVLKAEWPQLYAVWGNKYGSTSTTFNVIDMRDRSPLGIGTWFSNVDSVGGAFNVTLGVPEIPSHSHPISLRGSGTAGGTANRANAPTQTTVASNLVTDAVGGDQPHLNLHPVIGVQYIVYGGRA